MTMYVNHHYLPYHFCWSNFASPGKTKKPRDSRGLTLRLVFLLLHFEKRQELMPGLYPFLLNPGFHERILGAHCSP